MSTPLLLLAAFVLATLAAARLTRFVVHDDFPPMEYVRGTYRRLVGYGPWEGLVTCPFCFAPYAAGGLLALGIGFDVWTPDLSELASWWWIVVVWASMSYLAAMIVVRDEPPE